MPYTHEVGNGAVGNGAVPVIYALVGAVNNGAVPVIIGVGLELNESGTLGAPVPLNVPEEVAPVPRIIDPVPVIGEVPVLRIMGAVPVLRMIDPVPEDGEVPVLKIIGAVPVLNGIGAVPVLNGTLGAVPDGREYVAGDVPVGAGKVPLA